MGRYVKKGYGDTVKRNSHARTGEERGVGDGTAGGAGRFRRAIVGLAIIIFSSHTAFTLGVTDETAYEPVTGEENWSYEIPVEDLEPGTYNLLIRAADEAGNEAFGGPVNIVVDPESDIPQTFISTPSEGSIVGQRLVVLGTATDDDAVSSVSVSLNDATPVTADGGEFWEASFDLTALDEGVHTVTAVATDSNGIESPPVTRSFRYDASGPTVELTEPRSGALATGRVRVEGAASDLNGLQSLSVRPGRDGPEEELRVREGRLEDDFSYQIDTTEFEDGPLVLWFTAADTAGSETRVPFLLIVDNTPPEITRAAPSEPTVPTGTVLFSGSITDAVGIASVTYETSTGETGEIDFTPGDPFWSVPVSFTDGRRGSIEVTATDDAGNTAVLEHTVELDDDADLPRIVDVRAAAGYVSGYATDDDGIAAVEYRIGDDEWSRIDTSRSFALQLPERMPGTYELGLRAIDTAGRTGPETEQDVEITAAAPLLGGLEAGDGPLRPGQVIYEGEELAVSGTVSAAWDNAALEYRLDEGDWRTIRLGDTDEDGGAAFELTVGGRGEPGRHDLDIRVSRGEDTDLVSTFYYILQRLPEEPDPDETYLTEIPDGTDLYLPDGRIEGGTLRFRNARPLTGFVAGDEIASARLEPQAQGFTVDTDGSTVSITPGSAARAEDVRLVVETEGGRTLRSDALDLFYDVAAPELAVTSPATDAWLSDDAELTVEADADLGEVEVEYAVGDAEFSRLRRGAPEAGSDGAAGSGTFTARIPAPPDGGTVPVTVRATDAAGNTAVRTTTLNFDGDAPQITIITPDAETPVNGTVTVIGRLDDEGPVETLQWSADGEEFEPLEVGPSFAFPVSLTQYVDTDARPIIEATDRAGNVRRLEMSFSIAAEADIPRVSIQLPLDGSVQREDFVISGTAFDDDDVADIRARIDDGEFRSVGAGDSFSIPIDIGELGDNEHTVAVKAVDPGGVESEPVEVTFGISLESPVGDVEYPRLAEAVSDRVVMTGTASDANGIEAVRLSFDNGATFVRANPDEDAGLERWSYALESDILTDGLHAVQVELTDGYGTTALFSSLVTVDNTPPVVELNRPDDGRSHFATLLLSGDVHDEQGLADVQVRLAPIAQPAAAPADAGTAADTAAEPADTGAAAAAAPAPAADPIVRAVEPRAGGVLREEIDISGLPAGSYSLSVIATDESANRTSDSRDLIIITDFTQRERVEVYTPLAGSEETGAPVVEGRVVSVRSFERVRVELDGVSVGTAEIGPDGFFAMPLERDTLEAGSHTVGVVAEAPGAENLASEERSFTYEAFGPWISVESHRSGDTVSARPFISGTAGYRFEPPDGLEEGSREYRRAVEDFEVKRIDVSLDEGASWREVSGTEEWRYRIETAGVPEGLLPVLVRATAVDGRQAYRRVQLRVDTVPPTVDLDFPRESDRFNDVLLAGGSAFDANGLGRVDAILRDGSKSRYQVPEFIQGLYGDVHVLGASTWDVGVGLTFFDDNVKLQAQFGQAPPGRFSGTLVGGKLLANVARVPASYFFGPDLDFLSASLALGANFSYYTEEELVIGGIVGQLEFPIITNDAWRVLNSYSLYTEGQLWFISSDIQGGAEAKLSFGLRVQLL